MRLENAVAADVLERILSAYGFTMQKELSDKLGIAKSNVASWLQRGQVPGNVLVQCALDTGVDVKWLVDGMFANANLNHASSYLIGSANQVKGKELIERMLCTGGRPVLQRVMEAYGVKTQKELSEHLGISTGTISTWVRREFFPGDVVIACALDTGISLEWLATGEGQKFSCAVRPQNDILSVIKLDCFQLREGELRPKGTWSIDKLFIENFDFKPTYIFKGSKSWLVDLDSKKLENGLWLLKIDGNIDIYHVERIPGEKLYLQSNKHSFECYVSDVIAVGSVCVAMEKFQK